MARHLVYDKPLMVKLPPALKKRLKRAAVEHDSDMSKMTRQAIEDYLDRLERRGRDALIERMTGSATSGMTTDEIMALTRGE